MCEYCGCQQISVIDQLTREHEAVVALIGQIESSLAAFDLGSAVRRCRLISAILAPHTVVEEEGLFPEMADAFPEHVQALRSEHREIETVLAEAANGLPADPSWPVRLSGALYLLREHILKEQDGVFPAALAALDSDQWERIEAVRARISARSSLNPAVTASTTASTTSSMPTTTLAPTESAHV